MKENFLAASGGSGSVWPWLGLGLGVAALAALVIGVVLKVRARSLRHGWPERAAAAYAQGSSLVSALKSGQQNGTALQAQASAYSQQLLLLQRESPGEDSRWVLARVAAATDGLRLAVIEQPGTEQVRISTADLEEALRELRDAASLLGFLRQTELAGMLPAVMLGKNGACLSGPVCERLLADVAPGHGQLRHRHRKLGSA